MCNVQYNYVYVHVYFTVHACSECSHNNQSQVFVFRMNTYCTSVHVSHNNYTTTFTMYVQ